MNKLLIHNNNIAYKNIFESHIGFPPLEDVDKIISTKIISDIKKSDVEIIFIKDNLSSNYLELYGLRVAYYIRLSQELGDKRYLPIVIISDLNSHTLNKLEPMANILFTKNIFIVKNSKDAIKEITQKEFKNLTEDEYSEFLNHIKVEQPKDYLSHHSIANEWSMYRWAEYLDVNTPDIIKIKDTISSMLYFKYLQAKFPIQKNQFFKYKQQLNGNGRVLYIDDEWEKGWKSIFEHIFKENEKCHLKTVEEVYKDKTQDEIISFIMEDIISFDPDVIILDIRLHEDDFSKKIVLADFTGIQIFDKIKEINPGIQVIIFTASNNSLLLDELYNYDSSILGYVKKEHPKNYNLTTQSNINTLINLVNKGFENKYLKEIWSEKKQIESKLLQDPFNQYIANTERYKDNLAKLIKESEYIFDILNTEKENKFNYALVSLATCLDALQSIFIDEYYNNGTKEYYYLGCMITEQGINSLPKQITYIIKKSGNKINNVELKKLNKARNYYIHSNPDYIPVDSKEIKKWFILLKDIISKIKNQKIKKRKLQKELGSIDGLQSIKDKLQTK